MNQRKFKLSEAGLRVLRNVDAGRSPDFGLRGRSAYGGLVKTCAALRRAGLLTVESELTEAGRAQARRVQVEAGQQ